MTEFKKATELCADLRGVAGSIQSFAAACGVVLAQKEEAECAAATPDGAAGVGTTDSRTAYAALERYRTDGAFLRGRMDKLLAKAREKDPDKMVFNETMVGRIEALGVAVDEVLGMVTDEAAAAVETAYAETLAADRVSAARAASVAQGAAAAAEAEAEQRFLLQREALAWYAPTADAARAERFDVRARADAAAEVRWRQEEARRAREAEAFAAVARACTSATKAKGALDAFLNTLVATAFASTAPIPMADVAMAVGSSSDHAAATAVCAEPPAASRGATLRAALELLHALLQEPDAEGLRTIRASHPNALASFGHLLAVTRPAATVDGNTNEWRRALASRRCAAAEAVLACAGFVPSYTKNPSATLEPPVQYLLDEAAGAEVAIAPAEALSPDDGRVDGGWAGYGERWLTLREPEPAKDPDGWIAWHDGVVAVRDALRRITPRR
jgi:hypothetical protein